MIGALSNDALLVIGVVLCLAVALLYALRRGE